MPPFIDLINYPPFGRLTVIERATNDKAGHIRWKCHCDCGNIAIVHASALRGGLTKSCGCLKREMQIAKNYVHGMSYAPEYNIWVLIIKRCTNPRAQNFKYYGGRGITVCSEWRHDFMAFYNHIGKRPSKKYTIERINNNLGYFPGNIKWATMKEQNNNKRNNRNITIHEWTMNLSQWAKFVGQGSRLIGDRLRRGWPPTKAIFYPIRHKLKSTKVT